MKTKRVSVPSMLAGFLLGVSLMLLVSFLVTGGRTPFTPLPPPLSTSSPGLTKAYGEPPDLITSAYAVAGAISKGDFSALSDYVHPDGVLFTPFSTVQKDRDLSFAASEVKAFSTQRESYLWGVYPLSGEPINLTPGDFFKEILQIQDYTAAPILGINRVAKSGNASENIAEQFPDDSFVDFYFPPQSSEYPEWSSLKLVFRADTDGNLKLAAIVRSVYSEQ